MKRILIFSVMFSMANATLEQLEVMNLEGWNVFGLLGKNYDAKVKRSGVKSKGMLSSMGGLLGGAKVEEKDPQVDLNELAQVNATLNSADVALLAFLKQNCKTDGLLEVSTDPGLCEKYPAIMLKQILNRLDVISSQVMRSKGMLKGPTNWLPHVLSVTEFLKGYDADHAMDYNVRQAVARVMAPSESEELDRNPKLAEEAAVPISVNPDKQESTSPQGTPVESKAPSAQSTSVSSPAQTQAASSPPPMQDSYRQAPSPLQDPYRQAPSPQEPYRQPPLPQESFRQPPPPQEPYRQPPLPQEPYRQAPPQSQDPYRQASPPQSTYIQAPLPPPQDYYRQAPNAYPEGCPCQDLRSKCAQFAQQLPPVQTPGGYPQQPQPMAPSYANVSPHHCPCEDVPNPQPTYSQEPRPANAVQTPVAPSPAPQEKPAETSQSPAAVSVAAATPALTPVAKPYCEERGGSSSSNLNPSVTRHSANEVLVMI